MRVLYRYIASLLLICLMGTGIYANSVIGIPTKVAGQSLRWRKGTIKVAVSTSLTQANFNIKNDSEVAEALTRSFQAWEDASDVSFQWTFTDQNNVSAAGVAGDGVSLITIAPTAENAMVFGKEVDTEAARTRVFYGAKGFITEADIVLNPYQLFSTDGTFGTFDLQATLTHELGHLLGLRHSGVMGSTMSSSFSKNGLFGMPDLAMRKLDESDVSGIRELYGAADDDLCCGAIYGRLAVPPAKSSSRSIQVWAEDVATGRVAGISDVNVDGSFKIGGLPVADYTVYWQRRDDVLGNFAGQVGKTSVANGGTAILAERLTPRRSTLDIRYVGFNGQLAESAVGLTAGQEEYTLYLGGVDLDPASINIESGSPFVRVDPLSFLRQDFGEGVSGVSFRVQLAEGSRPGAYSLFVSRSDGSRVAMIGALRVE
jgi:hypothetical protein